MVCPAWVAKGIPPAHIFHPCPSMQVIEAGAAATAWFRCTCHTINVFHSSFQPPSKKAMMEKAFVTTIRIPALRRKIQRLRMRTRDRRCSTAASLRLRSGSCDSRSPTIQHGSPSCVVAGHCMNGHGYTASTFTVGRDGPSRLFFWNRNGFSKVVLLHPKSGVVNCVGAGRLPST